MVTRELAQNPEVPHNSPAIEDVVCEPYLDNVYNLIDTYNVTSGRFVRIGELVLVVPFIKFTSYNQFPFNQYPVHVKLPNAGSKSPDEILSVKTQMAIRDAEKYAYAGTGDPLLNSRVHDAGMYHLNFADRLAQELNITGERFNVGPVTADSRQRSVEAFQKYLGTAVTVASKS